MQESPVSPTIETHTAEQTTWWGKLRAFLTGSAQRQARENELQTLNMAIELYPQNALHFLLRGEFFLKQKRYHLAQDDLQQALNLAREQYQRSQWGIAEQAIQNRAEFGLKQVQRFVTTERVHKEE
jgi:tetratricopeptide (TPR) repeat protein